MSTAGPNFDVSRLQPIEDVEVLSAIQNAIASVDSDLVMRGGELEALSSGTEFEALDAASDGIFWADDTQHFEAVGTVYVTLNYGGTRDPVSMSDAYPAYVYGHNEGKSRAAIDRVEVDVSSFYE